MLLAMNFEFLVGLRYIRARSRANGSGGILSFISAMSIAGIALGVATLIVVLSVVNGFQQEIRSHILGVVSHGQIESYTGSIDHWEAYTKALITRKDVQAIAPFVQAQGMFVADEQVHGVLVRGIDPKLEEQVGNFSRFIKSGSLEDLKNGEFNVILGADLAKTLQTKVGEKVTLVSPQGTDRNGMIIPRANQFNVVGIFSVDMFEYDNGLALIHIKDAQTLYQTGDAVSGIRLKFDDLFAAPNIVREISQFLPEELYASDWTSGHAQFFIAVDLTKNMMFLVLWLIIAVAAFNIVSALVMSVQDKRADIAILRTLGANTGSIMLIFMIQGVLMGLIGLILGVGLGVLLSLNLTAIVSMVEHILGFQFLTKEVYFISQLPSQLQWKDVFITSAMAFVLSVFATLYPSWRAARVNPAEALRYE